MTDTSRADFELFMEARNKALSNEGHTSNSRFWVTNAHYPTWEASRVAQTNRSEKKQLQPSRME